MEVVVMTGIEPATTVYHDRCSTVKLHHNGKSTGGTPPYIDGSGSPHRTSRSTASFPWSMLLPVACWPGHYHVSSRICASRFCYPSPFSQRALQANQQFEYSRTIPFVQHIYFVFLLCGRGRLFRDRVYAVSVGDFDEVLARLSHG